MSIIIWLCLLLLDNFIYEVNIAWYVCLVLARREEDIQIHYFIVASMTCFGDWWSYLFNVLCVFGMIPLLLNTEWHLLMWYTRISENHRQIYTGTKIKIKNHHQKVKESLIGKVFISSTLLTIRLSQTDRVFCRTWSVFFGMSINMHDLHPQKATC